MPSHMCSALQSTPASRKLTRQRKQFRASVGFPSVDLPPARAGCCAQSHHIHTYYIVLQVFHYCHTFWYYFNKYFLTGPLISMFEKILNIDHFVNIQFVWNVIHNLSLMLKWFHPASSTNTLVPIQPCSQYFLAVMHIHKFWLGRINS